MKLFLHLEVKPLMTLTTVLYLSCALISGHLARSEERFSRNAETDLVCRLLLEKKKEASAYGIRAAMLNIRLLAACRLHAPSRSVDRGRWNARPGDSTVLPS